MAKGLLHGIYRIDNDATSTHAWVVTLRRRSADLSEYFSDGVYGGPGPAWTASRATRNSR